MCKVYVSLLISSKYHQITLLLSHVVLIKWKVNILAERQLASIQHMPNITIEYMIDKILIVFT